jgi:hypothetical protein
VPTLAYTPDVEDVAKYLRARTRGPSGAELGTFTDDTVPTDQQVTGIIDLAMPFVSGLLGDVSATCEQGARSLAALKAAEMVEISYFPEQLAPGGTVSALRALFADLLPSVQSCVSGGGGGGPDGDSTVPSSFFCDIDPYGGTSPGWAGGRWIDGRDPVEFVPVIVDPDP